MWHLQLTVNLHKVRCTDCTKSLLTTTTKKAVLMLMEHMVYMIVADHKEIS